MKKLADKVFSKYIITEEESLRARCNHRTADGMSDALSFDPVTGEARCSICGYRFRPVEPDMSL